MNIGEKIKELRKKNGLTQEQLADRLRISYQAVSKWETGAACPDLSLIAPLTKIFNVSADELLGINDTEPDARYEELKKEFDLTFATEDFVKRQEICETAVKEYPGDMKWLSNLAWTVSNRSFEYKDNEKYAAEQEKAIKLFDTVIKNTADEYLRGNAIDGITQLLGWRGRKDEARQYADMLPERSVRTRDSVMENVLEGDELIRFKQNRINEHFEGMLWDLSLMPNENYSDLIRSLVQVMIPDGNYLEYNHSLYYSDRRAVNHAIKTGENTESILALLEEMKRYAKEYDKILFDAPGIYKFTVPHLSMIEEDAREWIGNQGTRMSDDFKEFLQDKQFDFLRGSKTFQNLTL
ncbi:MAG: helix-turn-helix transcriptional regulator [Clostridia bacterium]|nr:helix-turn-helix transcriptional regulator [Clostridia bacterium]